MSRAITLERKGSCCKTKSGNYLLQLRVISAVGVDKEIFVFQRRTTPDNKIDDVFVAVATPVQMEDLDKNSPSEFTHYFRKSEVTLVGYSEEYIEQVWLDIQAEVNNLINDLNIMYELGGTEVVAFNGGTPIIHPVEASAYLFNFLNVPLLDRPAGKPVLNDGVWTITEVDTNRVGWVPVANSGVPEDRIPTFAKFFYNLPAGLLAGPAIYNALDNPGISSSEKADARTLKQHFPPNPIDYHFLYVNGVLQSKRDGLNGIYSVTSDGIWWFKDTDGTQPWSSSLPEDWEPADWLTVKGPDYDRPKMTFNCSITRIT